MTRRRVFDERMRRALGVHAERFAILSALMDDAHPSHEKHRYMPFIAVAPGHQRRRNRHTAAGRQTCDTRCHRYRELSGGELPT